MTDQEQLDSYRKSIRDAEVFLKTGKRPNGFNASTQGLRMKVADWRRSAATIQKKIAGVS